MERVSVHPPTAGEAERLCAAEPIHQPGAVKPDGCLVAFTGDGVIVSVSANSAEWLGEAPRGLLGRHVVEVFGDQARSWDVEGLPALGDEGPRVEAWSQGHGAAAQKSLDGTDSREGRVVLLHHGRDGLGLAEVLGDDPRSGMAIEAAIGRMIGRSMGRVSQGSIVPWTEKALLESAVEELRRATGFARVMAYKLHPDSTGEVVAESLDAVGGSRLLPLIGMSFPASDIPEQARALYLGPDRVRWVGDVESPAVEQAGERGVDLGGAVLRRLSPMHMGYLSRMGVRSSLSVSVVVQGRLWGLVIMHDTVPRRVPGSWVVPLWSLGRVIGSQLMAIEAATGASQRRVPELIAEIERGLLASLEADGDLVVSLREQLEAMLGLFEADGISIRWGDARIETGLIPDGLTCERVCLALTGAESLVGATSELSTRLPGVSEAMRTTGGQIAGALAVRFSHDPLGGVVWYRREEPWERIWAGNPQNSVKAWVNGTTHVQTREDFQPWPDVLLGRSKPWKPDEIEAGRAMGEALGHVVLKVCRLIEEIGARRRAEEELKRANEDLRAFAYAASHDLKQPLRGVSMTLELLERHLFVDADPRAVQLMGRARANAGRMRALIDAMAGLSRVSTASIRREPIELNGVVDECFLAEAVAVRAGGGRLERGELPRVVGDPALVSSLLSNLIGNAVKYRREGVAARVRVEGEPVEHGPEGSRGRGALIRVIDNGKGIPPGELETVFTPFKRGSSAVGVEGTGLGPALCRRVVERHGGRVWIESSPGEGTTVTIWWPERPGA